MSNRESDIAGPRARQTGETGVLYAAQEPAVPAPVSRRVARAKVSQRVKRRKSLIYKTATWLQPSDKLVIPVALARLQVVADRIFAELESRGYLDVNGDPVPAVDTLRRLALAQERLASAI